MNDKLLDNDFALVTAARLSANALAGETSEDGHEIISISHQHCTARLSLYGGQVLSFVPAGHKDIFWLSDSAYIKQERLFVVVSHFVGLGLVLMISLKGS